MRLWAAALVVVTVSCDPLPSSSSLRLVPLPQDTSKGVANAALRTPDHIFISPITGGLYVLSADEKSWAPVEYAPLVRFLPDFANARSFGLTASDTFPHQADGSSFAPIILNLWQPPGFDVPALLGRDASNRFWSVAMGVGQVWLGSMGADDSAWQGVALSLPPLKRMGPLKLTSSGRVFFRVPDAGIYEFDVQARAVVERVGCNHELFRPSHPDYTPCQQDTFLIADRRGGILIYTPNHELWAIANQETTPTLVVDGTLPELERTDPAGFNFYSPGAPSFYVDPRGRLWLAFRWGENTGDDTSYLYIANPGASSRWSFLSKTLPRNITLAGDGQTPLLVNGSADEGLLIFRLEE